MLWERLASDSEESSRMMKKDFFRKWKNFLKGSPCNQKHDYQPPVLLSRWTSSMHFDEKVADECACDTPVVFP